MKLLPRTLAPLLCFAALAAFPAYRSAALDAAGRLHITPASGGEIRPAPLPGQVSFGSPAVSTDGRTVGWLALYPYPDSPGGTAKGEPIAGALVLFRGGLVAHIFRTQQVFWDWQFQDGGSRVAYSTGPTHGGAAECVLRDVATGKIAASWQVRSDGDPPAWARALRF